MRKVGRDGITKITIYTPAEWGRAKPADAQSYLFVVRPAFENRMRAVVDALVFLCNLSLPRERFLWNLGWHGRQTGASAWLTKVLFCFLAKAPFPIQSSSRNLRRPTL